MIQGHLSLNPHGEHEGCLGLRDVPHADRGDVHGHGRGRGHGRGHGRGRGRGRGLHAWEKDAHPPAE